MTKAQTLYIHKLIKDIIVSKNKNLIFVAFQVVTPSLKGFNNRQELSVMNFVPNLSKNHFSREISYKMPLANFGFRKI